MHCSLLLRVYKGFSGSNAIAQQLNEAAEKAVVVSVVSFSLSSLFVVGCFVVVGFFYL